MGTVVDSKRYGTVVVLHSLFTLQPHHAMCTILAGAIQQHFNYVRRRMLLQVERNRNEAGRQRLELSAEESRKWTRLSQDFSEHATREERCTAYILFLGKILLLLVQLEFHVLT